MCIWQNWSHSDFYHFCLAVCSCFWKYIWTLKWEQESTLLHSSVQFSSVQSLIRLFATPWTAACQASLSIANSQSLLKFMSIESVMPSHHLIPCCPLLFLPSIFPSIRVFPSGLPCPISRGSSWPRGQIHVLYISCTVWQVLYNQHHLECPIWLWACILFCYKCLKEVKNKEHR